MQETAGSTRVPPSVADSLSGPTRAAAPAAEPARWYAAERLTGARVALQPLRYEDGPGYLAALHSDDGAAEVFAHLQLPLAATVPDAQAQIAIALSARARGERMPFAQLDAGSGQFIGTTSYYDIDPAVRTLAIGHTWLGRRWWRTGHNSESKLLLLGHAFETLGAARVVWHTDIRNVRSQEAIERLGAVREGVLRKHRIRLDGSWRDTVLYSMTDDEWPAARTRLRERLQQ